MRLIYLFALLVSSPLLLSCQKPVPDAACPDAGSFAKRVENSSGRIYYDSTEAKYMILVPNSMDSHDVGFVCALAPPLQQPGLAVRFSGRYYNYNKTLQRFAGDRFYSLTLETITPL